VILLSGFSRAEPRHQFRLFVPNAPTDLSITLYLANGDVITPDKHRIFWDNSFAFPNLGIYVPNFADARLVVESRRHSFEVNFDVPEIKFYSPTYVLSLTDESLEYRAMPTPAMSTAYTALHVIQLLSLVFVKVLFLRSRYKEWRSYVTVAIVSFITHGFFLLFLPGFNNMVGFTIGLLLIPVTIALFVVETLLFIFLLREQDRIYAVLYSLKANAAALGVSLIWAIIYFNIYTRGVWSGTAHWLALILL